MPDLPNIKKEILEYILSEDPEHGADMRAFCEERGYSETRVAKKVDELYPLIECGVSPMYPWIQYQQQQAVYEQLKEWENE